MSDSGSMSDSKDGEFKVSEEILEKLNTQIDTQMKKAFFDLVDSKLVEDSKLDDETVKWMGTLLKEVKDRILYLIKGERGELGGQRLAMYTEIDRGLDIPFFEQRIKHGVFSMNDMGQIVLFSLAKLKDLQSPERDGVLDEIRTRLFADNPVDDFRMGKAFGDFIRAFHLHMDTVEKDLKFSLLYFEKFERFPDMSVEDFESKYGKK